MRIFTANKQKINYMRLYLLLALVLLLNYQSLAQKKYDNDVRAIYLNFSGAFQIPQGDMKVRFGNNSNLGIQTELITGKTNFIFGLYGQFLYGTIVKENVERLYLVQGVMLGTDQTATALYKKERGLLFGGHFGKLFAINHEKNPRSGIRATLGIGMFRHWIKITDEFNSAKQFQGDYLKGYDRLTAGIALTPFLGYQHTSLSRYLNLTIGVEYTAAFTQSQRSWDYDLFSGDNNKRIDGLLGFRVGFSLPIYIGDSKADVEYK